MLIVALIRHNAMSHKQGDVCRNTACHLPTDIQPFLVGELYIGKLLPVRFNAPLMSVIVTVASVSESITTFTLNKGGSTQISTELISASLYITRLFICVVF
mgnify:CR=1 FL=1